MIQILCCASFITVLRFILAIDCCCPRSIERKDRAEKIAAFFIVVYSARFLKFSFQRFGSNITICVMKHFEIFDVARKAQTTQYCCRYNSSNHILELSAHKRNLFVIGYSYMDSEAGFI